MGFNRTSEAGYGKSGEQIANRKSISLERVNPPAFADKCQRPGPYPSRLLRRNVPGVANDLYRRYPRIFNLLNISAAPLLIEASAVPTADLSAEGGGDAAPTLDHIRKTLQDDREHADTLLQQSNFRLRRPVPASALKMC